MDDNNTNLKPLIRLKSHQLEQKQRALAEIYREREMHQSQKDELLEKMEKERQALDEMGDDVNAQFQFLSYSENVKQRIESIDAHMKALDERILMAQNLIRDAFADLKRIEIIQQRRDDDVQAAIKKKEDIELDEIGLQQHRKGHKEH